MRKIVIRFPIVVYPSELDDVGRFTAHCLNVDVVADDDTIEGAVLNLLELIEVKLDASEEFQADPFDRAPEKYWQLLGQAQKLSPELIERIVRTANSRRGIPQEAHIDLREQCDVRQVAMAV